MRGLLISFIFIVLFILTFLFGTSSSSDASEPISENSPLPLTPKHDTAIVAAPDGTIYFVEDGSGKILWSFSSGASIYSSYQQLPNHEGEKSNVSADFFVDFGDDWKLYLHRAGQKKALLPVSAEEFVRRTPFVSPSGGIILGSKKTSIFLVDEESGKVLRKFKSDDHSPSFEADETSILTRNEIEDWLPSTPLEAEAVEKTLYVTRTDYVLKYIYGKTGRVMWYLKFAEIEASYHCEGDGSFFGGFPQMDINLNKKLPINCQTQPIVYRVLDRGSLEPIIKGDKLQEALPGGSVLSLPALSQNPILVIMGKLIRFDHGNEKGSMLALPSSESEETKANKSVSSLTELKDSESLKEPHFWPSVVYSALAPVLMALFLYVRRAISRQGGNMYKHSENLKVQSVTPKKKKNRKAGTNKRTASVNNIQEEISKDNAVSVSDGLENIELNFSNNNDDVFVDRRKIGKLTVFSKEIAKGSNGTIVLEGSYDGRPVAVKRLVRTHHDVAVKEIKNLIASDQHPNIVRWYGVEYDRDFVYLSLERCTCSLHDLISFCASQSQITSGKQYDESPFSVAINFQFLADKEMELWRFNGYPSAGLLKLMRDIVCGVAHLHELGIVHRDLKPQNVLVIKDRSISAKISDMGISKRLDGEMTSLTKNATGYGTSGWQAPEQLRNERQTRAVDLFSLGCILFFCITGGKHPFGESLERDINIVSDHKDLFLIDNIPEATDLISRLLDSDPQLRPNTVEVLCHPLFWNSEKRLSFLRDFSDRVELEDRSTESELLDSLENCGKIALGCKWDEKMDTAFLSDIGRYRHYKFDSVRDLLRVIRNKLNHFRELSKEIQVILGPVPEGFDHYFSTRFPKLLIELYKVALKYCAAEEIFWKYFRSSQV